MKVTAEPNMAQLTGIKRWLGGIKNGMSKAMMRAVNHELVPTRTAMIKVARKHTKLKVKTIRSYFNMRRARVDTTNGGVIAESAGIPAIYFWPKPASNKRWIRGTKKRANPPAGGVSVEFPSTGRITLPGTFIVDRAKAWPRAADRKPPFDVVERAGAKRLPIHMVTGPSVADLLDPSLEDLAGGAAKRLLKRVIYEAGRLLETGR